MGMSAPHPVAPRVGLFAPTSVAGLRGGRDSTHPLLRLRHIPKAVEGGCAEVVHGTPDATRVASKIGEPRLMPAMPRSSTATPPPATYEQALAELESLVQAMEAGKMPLDQLLSSYQRGAELLQQCRQRLQGVEDQVKLLEDGQLKPWTGA
jgi:exodeoxyribonuclease VII small subunit